MALLYAALAYLAGLVLAAWWWQVDAPACPLPPWLWLLPAALLPFVSFLPRRQKSLPPMRWPPEAGFDPPDQGGKPSLPAALALCLLAGALRYGGEPFTRCWTPADLAYYNLPADRTFERSAPQVTLTGFADSYPLIVDGKQELVVAAESVRQDNADGETPAAVPVRGRVRVTTGGELRLRYGQWVTVSGRLSEPAVFDDFSYQDYLATQGVRSVLYNGQVQVLAAPEGGNPLLRFLYGLRSRGEALIDRHLAEPYAALANGMLLGIEAGIPDTLYDQFNAAGVSHVIVISGTNVALVSGVIVAAAARLLGKRRALWPALGAIACYALLVGGDASVTRAAVMGGLFVTAAALDRRSTALVSLLAACMAMTLINPLALWDVGLQLSSTATAGLVLLSPFFVRRLRRLLDRSPAGLRVLGEDVLAVTLAASLATLPLALYHFGRLSLVALPANLLIAPVQPLILLGGSAALLVGLAGQELLAGALLWLPWLGLAWTVAAVHWCAGLPFAAVNVGDFGLPHMILAYAALGSALGLARRRNTVWAASVKGTGMRCGGGGIAVTMGLSPPHLMPLRVWGRMLVSPFALAAGAVLAALIWAALPARPDGRLHVWFLDVGQGDGILIQTPSGRQVLIDGGSSSQTLLSELGAVMPFWDRTLDLAVITHPDADHMAAQVEADGRFAIAAAWETPESAANADSAAWQAAVEGAGAAVQLQAAGGWADLGDGVALWVLGPPAGGLRSEDADNDNSLVAKLVYGEFSVLLTGDAEAAAEAQLVAAGAPIGATVLKVAHHGSKWSTGDAFVAAVDPLLAVIQVGENRYGHPADAVIQRLAGRTLLRTDQDGRIEVVSDGRQMWVETVE